MIHMIRFPILSVIMHDDQLAHLYITEFMEYNKGLKSTPYESHAQISLLSILIQNDQLAHLHILGFTEYIRGLKSNESHDQISRLFPPHAG
jgi:hypothetical protein